MKQLICVCLILVPFLALFSEGALLGGWKQIKDVSDPSVVEIAKFAIAEHKKQSKVDLVYEKVVEGKTQVVSGTKYDLIISAKNGGASKKYEAVVWDKPWEKFRSLMFFKAL